MADQEPGRRRGRGEGGGTRGGGRGNNGGRRRGNGGRGGRQNPSAPLLLSAENAVSSSSSGGGGVYKKQGDEKSESMSMQVGKMVMDARPDAATRLEVMCLLLAPVACMTATAVCAGLLRTGGRIVHFLLLFFSPTQRCSVVLSHQVYATAVVGLRWRFQQCSQQQ